MAKQLGPFFITGTIDQVCFYRMDGSYYARVKSSLDGKRVKKDPAFRQTMRYAELMGKASSIASIVYRALPEKQKIKGLFRKLVAQAIRLLKENKTAEEIVELLKPKKVRKVVVPVVCKNESKSDESLFADKILSGVFGEVMNAGEDFYCFDDASP
jgi:hypothetical protein